MLEQELPEERSRTLPAKRSGLVHSKAAPTWHQLKVRFKISPSTATFQSLLTIELGENGWLGTWITRRLGMLLGQDILSSLKSNTSLLLQKLV
jgi:hypothetical protein